MLGLWPDYDRGSPAQMTMGPIQKTFLMLRPFEKALTCSIQELKLRSEKRIFLGEGPG
jgi:hypothetical protein